MIILRQINNKLIWILFSVSIIIQSCNLNEPEEVDDEDLIFTDKIDLNDWITNPVTIDTAYFKGDELFIEVYYAGGCKEHVFELIVQRSIEKSNPPIVTVLLSHDSNDDNCEAWISKILKFNFQSYKTYLKENFGFSTAIIKFYNTDVSAIYISP